MAQLSMYIQGELCPEDACLIEAHLKTCGKCRDVATSLRLVGPLLGQMGTGPEVDQVDHSFALARANARAAREGTSGSNMGGALFGGWRVVGVAAAAVLAIGISLPDARPTSGVADSSEASQMLPKGAFHGSVASPIALSFSVQQQDRQLARGDDLGTYKSGDVLYFRCYLPTNGFVSLVRMSAADVEILSSRDTTGGVLMANRGDWDLTEGQQLLGYGLNDVKGPQRFIALFSEQSFVVDSSLLDLLRVQGGLEQLSKKGISADTFTVMVSPSKGTSSGVR